MTDPSTYAAAAKRTSASLPFGTFTFQPFHASDVVSIAAVLRGGIADNACDRGQMVAGTNVGSRLLAELVSERLKAGPSRDLVHTIGGR